jgi:hypothetical protein
MAQEATLTVEYKSTNAEGTPIALALPSSDIPQPTISDPQPGQAIQGKVDIIGSTNIDGLQFSEIEFAYVNNPTNTWFLIQRIEEPVNEGILSQWDTTTISDGTYDLRVTVYLEDGSQSVTTISGVRVRNYTPIETNTPTATSTPQPGDTPDPTDTPTPTNTPIPPTNTPLPENPAQLSKLELTYSLTIGALFTFGGFLVIGFYVLIKKYTTKM